MRRHKRPLLESRGWAFRIHMTSELTRPQLRIWGHGTSGIQKNLQMARDCDKYTKSCSRPLLESRNWPVRIHHDNWSFHPLVVDKDFTWFPAYYKTLSNSWTVMDMRNVTIDNWYEVAVGRKVGVRLSESIMTYDLLRPPVANLCSYDFWKTTDSLFLLLWTSRLELSPRDHSFCAYFNAFQTVTQNVFIYICFFARPT